MALNDNATLALDSGNYFTAPVGTALPTDLDAIDAEWENIGHTSLEDILSVESEGGEATVLGTLQNKSLRTRRSPRTETINFTLRQFDTAALRLYYGANAEVLPNGLVTNPSNPTPTSAAFLAVYVDGDNRFALWIPRCEILRADDLSIEDTESLAGLPIGVTPLQHGSNAYTYAVTPLGDEPPVGP